MIPFDPEELELPTARLGRTPAFCWPGRQGKDLTTLRAPLRWLYLPSPWDA